MDELEENKVSRFAREFQGFLDTTSAQRLNSELVRDFVDLKQWTPEEETVLKSRNQTPVVFDYIGEAKDYMVGHERDIRQDPKAFPRTKESEDGAQAVTDALRYVADNNEFDCTASDVFEDKVVEGCGAAITEVVERSNGEYEIVVTRIPWDRFYYDPHSRDRDFKDARFMGRVIWMDAEEAKEQYPDSKDEITDRMTSNTIDGDT